MVDKFRSIWYHSFAFKKCGCSSVVELQPSKLAARVRFPSPAPFLTGFPLFFYFGLGNLCSNLVVFSLTRKILPFSQKLAFASFLPIRSALGAFPFTRSKQEPFRVLFFCFSLGNLCSNLVAFSLTRKILPFSQKLAFASFLPIRSALGAFPFTRSIFNRVSPVFLFRAWETFI